MSLVLTRTQAMRANSNFDKYEYRASRYGALDLFMSQSEDPNGILTPELKQKARESIHSTLETPVIDFDANISIGNQRTLTIADSENTSRMLQITFSTYSWGFTMTPAMYMNNEIGMQRDFETKMMKYIYAFAKTLDQAALSVLAANKTAVVTNPLLYSFSSNTLHADFNQRENLFGDLNVIMEENDYFGNLHLVANGGVQSIMKKLQQHGLYNDVNKQNEFGDKIVHFTNNMTATSGKYGQGYAVQSGTVGMLSRFERDCLMGTRSADGHEWDIITLPMLNMQCGSYFYDSVGDYSGIAGAATADMVRTRKEHYGFAVDVAFLTAYNSAPSTRPSAIIGFDISNTNAQYAVPVQVVNTTTNPVNTSEVE